MIRANEWITIVRKDEGTKDGIYYAALPFVGTVVSSGANFEEGTIVIYKGGFDFMWDNVKYVALELNEIMAVVE